MIIVLIYQTLISNDFSKFKLFLVTTALSLIKMFSYDWLKKFQCTTSTWTIAQFYVSGRIHLNVDIKKK